MRRDSAGAAAKAAVATSEDLSGATCILALEVEGFKRIRAARFRMEPEGLTVLAGLNGQGKTSAIDALECLLGGGRNIPQRPVRDGEREAVIVAELPGFVVRRTIQPDRSTRLEVTRPDGTALDRPQDFLSALVGPIAFDPAELLRMAPKEQAETLRRLVGLDLSDLDAAKKQAFDTRTVVGRDRDRAKGHAESLPYFEHAPETPVDVAELGELLQAKHRHNQNVATADAELQRLQERRAQVQAQAKELQRQLAALKEQYESLGGLLTAKATQIDDLGGIEDTASVMDQLNEAEGINAQVRANEERVKALGEVATLRAEYDNLSYTILGYERERRQRLAACAFPVEGLSFTESGDVEYRGLPLDQASGAEQLRVSTAIAMAMNPTLKVAFVRDGSLLDLESLAIVDGEVRKAGGQVLIERVGHGDEAHVIIEDGAARPAEQKNGKVAA